MFNLPVKKTNFITYTLNTNEILVINELIASLMILSNNPSNDLNIEIKDNNTNSSFIYKHSNMFMKSRGSYNITIKNLSQDSITIVLEI